MPNQDDIRSQQELLATYRRTLAHLLTQAAHFGGVVFAPPATANGIAEARSQIQRIKMTLRSWGIPTDDHPDDTETIVSPIPASGPETVPAQVQRNQNHTERTQIFISYSHSDKRWLERLHVHLKPLERTHTIARWDDTLIEPGANGARISTKPSEPRRSRSCLLARISLRRISLPTMSYRRCSKRLRKKAQLFCR